MTLLVNVSIEANSVHPDQTVLSGSTLFVEQAPKDFGRRLAFRVRDRYYLSQCAVIQLVVSCLGSFVLRVGGNRKR